MKAESKKKLFNSLYVIFGIVCLFVFFEVYVPYSFGQKPAILYTVQKGSGYKTIALDLKSQGIIKNQWFFDLYVIISGSHSKLQAGSYDVSPSMSVAQIVGKIASGDVVKNTITIVPGWDLEDIGAYFESKQLSTKQDFLTLAKKDFSGTFDFLKDKPKNLSLEGYLFPDTYQIALGQSPDDIVKNILSNFDKKLTPDLRAAITKQKKSIFQIITMASIIEKEVKTLEDKKMVSGILWKRIENGIPLQVDSTINYATGKSDNGVQIQDTKINSPYNTYKYGGLPLGPICNPGLDSIVAAIYPTDNPYWYYLSATGTGQTIFSTTLDEHNAAAAKYLK